MKKFMDKDFLLHSAPAREIYKEIERLPIIDYHCHLDAKEIYENKPFQTITDAWLAGDHYKWRAMRFMGVEEKYITGDASAFEKFYAWACVMPYLAGNALYHFSHLELKRYLGIDEPLNNETAAAVFDKANETLKKLPIREIIRRSNVETIVTTNDPSEDLEYHKKLKSEKDFDVKVVPAFRPDKALNIEKEGFRDYIFKLAHICKRTINSLQDVKTALNDRLNYFAECGAPASDHGMDELPAAVIDRAAAEEAINKALSGIAPSAYECDAYKTELLLYLAGLYFENNMVMEIHFGCSRDNNMEMLSRLGKDCGNDGIKGKTGAEHLSALLNLMNAAGKLPKTLVFSLHPGDNAVITASAGSFQQSGVKGRVQQGAAWWFNDNKSGIEEHLKTYASLAPLDSFIGMLTDSRSFLSYTRHEYFRRILADYLGNLVKNGEYPESEIRYLIETAKNVSYYNAKNYFPM